MKSYQVSYIPDIDVPNVMPPIVAGKEETIWVYGPDEHPTRDMLAENARRKLSLAYGITPTRITHVNLKAA